jgi:hypothetical protein
VKPTHVPPIERNEGDGENANENRCAGERM